MPTPRKVKEISLPTGALVAAVILTVASPWPAPIFSNVETIPSGKPSTVSAISPLKPWRRSALTEKTASPAADLELGGRAVTERRGKELARVKGIGRMVSGRATVYCGFEGPLVVLPRTMMVRVPSSAPDLALSLILVRV